METENVSDWSNNISVSTGLQNVMDRYETDQKAIWYNGNIVLASWVKKLQQIRTWHALFSILDF